MTGSDLDAALAPPPVAPVRRWWSTTLAQLLPPLLLLSGCSFDTSGLAADDLGPADAPVDVEPGPDRAPQPDAGPGVEVGFDAPADAAPDLVDPAAPFGAPSPVEALNTIAVGEDDPTLTGDMLEIYFNRDGDIWRSARTTVTAVWAAPQVEVALSSASDETNPEITPDGLTIFFASTRLHADAKGAHDIFVAARASRSAAWSLPEPVEELNTPSSDHPGPAPDLLTMIVISDRVGTQGAHDLLISTRPSTSSVWGAPALLSALNSSEQESSAWLDVSATLLYYASARVGSNHDIYLSQRPGPGQPFGAPVNLTTLNSSAIDEDPWLSPDLRTIYFSSTRSGDNDLYIATR